MVRAKIRLNTNKEVMNFVQEMNSDGTINKYIVEDFEGVHRVGARSFLGMMYASSEFNDNMYLVNETMDGYFPSFVDKYRHPGEDGNYTHN